MDKYVLGNMESSRILVELYEEGKLSKRNFYKIRKLIHKFSFAVKSIDDISNDSIRNRVIILYRNDKFSEIDKIKCLPFAQNLTKNIISAIISHHII